MNDVNYAKLNQQFGLLGQVVFKEGAGGMPVAEVRNPQGSATLALQGAQVLDWTPLGAQRVIWLSSDAKFAPGKSVRGGVPICWPWFGPHASDPTLPAHGFARTVAWEVVATRALPDGQTWLAFRLTQTDATRKQWPYKSEVVAQFVVGRALDIDLGTRNVGTTPIAIGQALHTYFEIGDVGQVSIDGLDGAPYIDKVDGSARKQQAGPVYIDREVDRIYLETDRDCVINDPALKRRIRIAKLGSRSTVVWNPWIEKAEKMGDLGADGYRHMVCVESCNAASDVVTLAPKTEHHLWVRYSVEAL